MKIFGLAGWSGSGKTTLLEKVLLRLTSQGWTVSTIKHAHHNFDIDKPGKDSHRHREAGATEVLIASGHRWALMHELRDEAEPQLKDLLAHMSPVDLLLIEGFKFHPHPKVEVHRPALGKPMLWPDDPSIIAVASDVALPDCKIPVLDLNDAHAIADLIAQTVGLTKA